METLSITIYRRWSCWGYVKWSYMAGVTYNSPAYCERVGIPEQPTLEEMIGNIAVLISRYLIKRRTELRIQVIRRNVDGSHTYRTFKLVKPGRTQSIISEEATLW